MEMIATKKLKIDPDIAALFEDLEGWEYAELKRDIKAKGILMPLIVSQDFLVVCGHQRVRVAQDLKLVEVPAIVRSFESLQETVDYAVKDNLLRRQLNRYTKALLGLRWLQVEQKYAQQRQGTRTDLMDETSAKSFAEVGGPTLAKVGQKVGLSSVTMRKVRYIEENADDDTKAELRSGEKSIHGAYKKLREQAFTPPKGKPRDAGITRLRHRVMPKMDQQGRWKVRLHVMVPEEWYRGVIVILAPEEEESLLASQHEAEEPMIPEVVVESIPAMSVQGTGIEPSEEAFDK